MCSHINTPFPSQSLLHDLLRGYPQQHLFHYLTTNIRRKEIVEKIHKNIKIEMKRKGQKVKQMNANNLCNCFFGLVIQIFAYIVYCRQLPQKHMKHYKQKNIIY